MKVQFELTVKVIGSSLQEVDDGLVQAAGERLRARMTVSPSVASMVKIRTEEKETHEQASIIEAKDPVGQIEPISVETGKEDKPKRRATKKDGAEGPTRTAAEIEENGKLQKIAAKVEPQPQPQPQPTLTKDDAIQAIGRVNAKFGSLSPAEGINKVKECLAKFGAPSVTKMDPTQYAKFIDHCNSVCA